MPQVESSRSDYTGFMVNRIGLLALILGLSPILAGAQALQDAKTLAGGKSGAYDGGCSAGSCGSQVSVCQDEACRIQEASNGAMKTGGLVVAPGGEARPPIVAEVPAPALNPDKEGAKDKPSWFSRKIGVGGVLWGLGGAAAGAGLGFLLGSLAGGLGGPIGAVIGGVIGGILGFLMSRQKAK